MAGRIQWEAQVDSNVAKLLSETKELRDQLDGIKKGNYEIKLNIDDKKLEKVISNLDKMLESLGKGTGDFKEFENLSKQLNEIVSEVKELNKAFGGINDSGVSNLLSSIQSIDKSLSSLSEHITNVNKDFGSVGKNASDNVGQINEARKATEGLTEATKELANAQKKVGNKSNISSPIKDTFQGEKIEQATTSAKELDKTLEGVEIPKESFDEVIAKFNIIEEKAKNIAKIVRSDIQNADGTYNTSYNVKYKDGSSEILGENSNPQKLRSQNVLYDTKQIEKEAKALERAARQAQKLAEEKRKARQADKQTTQSSVDKALKDQLDAWEAIQKIRLQIAQTDSKDTTKLQNLKIQKKERQEDFLQAQKVLKANEELYDKESQLAKLDHERLETNEKINKLKLNNVDIGSVLSKGDDDLKKFEARKNQSEEYRGTVEKLKQSIEELRVLEQSMVKSKLLPDGEAQKINEAVASIEEYTNAIKNMPAVEKGSDEGSRTKLANRIHEYMDKNTRMTREFREEFENLIRVLRSGDDSVNIKDIARQFEDVKFRVKEAKLEGISFFDIFKNKAVYGAAARLAQYYLSFYDFIRYARYAVNALVELDTALVDLRKTTSMTENQLEDFYYASNDVAKQMGVTTAEIINQASAWSRLGFSTKEASTEMAKLSAQFAVISPGMDLDTSTDGLVSTMKAFGIEVEDVERRIMDNINRIGNTAATDNAEIVDMLTRSSAAMAVANNTLEETIALETSAVEITRNAETTGTAFKTLSMRIRGYDEETEELSEDLENISGEIADLTKTAKTPGGISLFSDKDKQTYKSTYQILKEISEIYDDLSDKQQAELLEKLAGKRGGQVVASILTNFDAAEKALREMEDAAGSADAEMSIIEDSLEYKINALKQTWVGTVQEMFAREDFGAVIDGLTKLSEAIGFVVDKLGLLGTVGLGVGLFKGIKNIGREKCYPSSNMPIVI